MSWQFKIKQYVRELLRLPSIYFCSALTTKFSISIMRRVNGIQLSVSELAVVIEAVKRKPNCKFLVFGVGNDSLLWDTLNRSGTTYFIEDNFEWLNKIKRQRGIQNIVKVDYCSKLPDWEAMLVDHGLLECEVDVSIRTQKWDVVLVDAPAGWNNDAPGRMKSIYLASKIGAYHADVFVHDCNRNVEQVYCDKFLKNENLVAEIEKLRHYNI